jgi:hypothetical protein
VFELKHIAADAIPAALAKAERYRLLNEPREAESICRDVLAVNPEHPEALECLVLALTDQFGSGYTVGIEQARQVLPRVRGEYERAYYTGLVHERWAKAQLAAGVPGYSVFTWFREAMQWFERAEALAPPGNDEAKLRWNACVRLLQREPTLPPPQAGTRAAGPHRDMPLE